jgi:ComF family protein
MHPLLARLQQPVQRLFNQLLPTTCLLCGCRLEGDLLCTGCELDLPHLLSAGDLCQQCALPLPSTSAFCGHCLRQPPAFSQSVIPFSYQKPLDFLIHGFKYRGNLVYGRLLAQSLVQYLQYFYVDHALALPSCIIPVPMHWTRRLHRGFNQTEFIARHIARPLQLPVETQFCRRRRRTRAQQGLSRSARQHNLRAAFAVTSEAENILQGKCVALLDDVVTTTATARELSQLLIKAGAASVHLWALARTPEKTGAADTVKRHLKETP